MAEPLEQRAFQRRNVVVGVLLVVAFVVELFSGRPHPAVVTLILGLLVAGLALGGYQAGRTVMDRYVDTGLRRRTEAVLVLMVVMAAAFLAARLLDAGRNDGQVVLAVIGLAVACFVVGFSSTSLRNLPDSPPDSGRR